MARKKLKLAFIENNSTRKATFMKRKKGLLKKMEELSTLCGIEACAIVYSPYVSQPEVWPSPSDVQSLLARFKTMSELEQSKKMLNQETFLTQRILKATKHVNKQKRDNREKEMTLLMFQSLSEGKVVHNNMLTMNDMNDIVWLIDQSLKDVNQRLETLDQNAPHIMTTPIQQSEMVVAPTLQVAYNEEMTMGVHGHGLDMHADTMQNMLFMDLVNGNGDEAMPFGDANLQNEFLPNLLP